MYNVTHVTESHHSDRRSHYAADAQCVTAFRRLTKSHTFLPGNQTHWILWGLAAANKPTPPSLSEEPESPVPEREKVPGKKIWSIWGNESLGQKRAVSILKCCNDQTEAALCSSHQQETPVYNDISTTSGRMLVVGMSFSIRRNFPQFLELLSRSLHN